MKKTLFLTVTLVLFDNFLPMKQFILVITLLFTQTVFGQQEVNFIQLANNSYYLNPAAGGMTNTLNAEMIGRAQWLGYSGKPRTMVFSMNTVLGQETETNEIYTSFLSSPPERKTSTGIKHVVGGTVLLDAIGPFSKTSLKGNYAIHLPFTKKVMFGAGIGLGWNNFNVNQDRIILYQENDATLDNYLAISSNQNILDANAGMVFYSEKLFLGFSVSQAFKNRAVFSIETDSYFERHYFSVLKYLFPASNTIEIEPIFVARIVKNAPFSWDLGARVIYDKALWLGINYRNTKNVTVQFGVHFLKNIYFAYGFEFSNALMKKTMNGTHELTLGVHLNKKSKSKRTENDPEEEKKGVEQ